MKIKKGDNVIVIRGNSLDKNKKGKILEVFYDKEQVVIENVNIKKHHQKGKGGEKGGIIEIPHPIHISNIMLWDEKAKKRSRVGFIKKEDGKKVRVLKASGTELS